MTKNQSHIYFLSDKISFPPPRFARPDGLLAVGGDLRQERLLLAYRMGIFPWYSCDEPIIWWSPDPRLVLYPHEIKVSKRLGRTIRQGQFHITMDTAFDDVITSCAQIRLEKSEETWIVDEMLEAYCDLHSAGYAHSVEAWQEGQLVGGLYGISLGRSFFGESMFASVPNASKVAFVKLVEYLRLLDFDIIDCQIRTSHLVRFGAKEMSRKQFLEKLEKSLRYPTKRGKWILEPPSSDH